jgi:signal transduction histidine kinase
VAGQLKQWVAVQALRFRQSVGEFIASPTRWYRRRVLWLKTVLFLAVLMVVTGSAFVHLFVLSSGRAKEIRRELFQRDLRDLVGRFDADERFVIDNNLAELLGERRALRPLLLPRQYYTGLPAGSAPLPRQPPRNCFVQLEPVDGSVRKGDRICAYFGENRAPGRYLYLAATLAEEELIPLKLGDTQLMADALKIQITAKGQTVAWWLTYQLPPHSSRPDRFELTAFRQVGDNQRDRDRKIEGWAYVQRQGQVSQVHLIARLDFREFLGADDDDAVWPPPGWRDTTLSVERKDAWANPPRYQLIQYKPTGISELSLSGLGAQIFNAYGSIRVEGTREGVRKTWPVEPPAGMREKLEPGPLGVKLSGGDLLWPTEPTSQPEPLPDTDLVITVSHPWRLVEKGFWQIALYLVALLVGGGFATWYFSKNLLMPIGDWSRYSERLATVRTDSDVTLPHAERRDEVGILATAINTLIRGVREQMANSQSEREARAAEARRKEQEEIENRMQNLKVMGHEIRSPLQALMALHRDPADKSRRYIERMLAALPHLLGGAATMDAIGTRELEIEEFDLAVFLTSVASNAEYSDISNVKYEGKSSGVRCVADLGMVEDAITHILNNAERLRTPDSPIRMVLVETADKAGVEIWNDGRQIPDENLELIFDFGFSTAQKTESEGHGVGLFVTKDYLRRMSGSISVRNHGSGVVFTVMLPVAPSLLA